jgi:hypothetical protein
MQRLIGPALLFSLLALGMLAPVNARAAAPDDQTATTVQGPVVGGPVVQAPLSSPSAKSKLPAVQAPASAASAPVAVFAASGSTGGASVQAPSAGVQGQVKTTLATSPAASVSPATSVSPSASISPAITR